MQGWLITHGNCLDGATAALVGQASGLTPIFVEPDRVEEAFELVTDNNPVYLADVSLKPDKWPSYQHRVSQLLDHHQSALPLQREPQVLIDQSRSGAHLMYDYAVDQGWVVPTPSWDRLCLAVERYDVWKPRHGLGQDLNRLFHHLGFDWYLSRFSQGLVPFTPDEGDLLARLIQEEHLFVQSHLKMAIRYDRGLPYPIYGVHLEDEGSVNVICHTLIEEGAALVLVLKPDNRLSVRSDVRVDAARLMEQLFHGGGHPRAAGGRLTAVQTAELDVLLGQVGHYLATL